MEVTTYTNINIKETGIEGIQQIHLLWTGAIKGIEFLD
jgi:hypothetical protein